MLTIFTGSKRQINPGCCFAAPRLQTLNNLLETLSQQILKKDELSLNQTELVLRELNAWLDCFKQDKANDFTSLPKRLPYEWLPIACCIIGVLIAAIGYISVFTLLLLIPIIAPTISTHPLIIVFLGGILPITGLFIGTDGREQTTSKLHSNIALLCRDLQKLKDLDDKYGIVGNLSVQPDLQEPKPAEVFGPMSYI